MPFIISTINITGDIDEIKVPPLLFLPFIENCFKHGKSGENKFEVEISFEIIDDRASKLSSLERAHLDLSNISEIIKF